MTDHRVTIPGPVAAGDTITLTVKVPLPAAPTLVVVPGNRSVTLSWK